MTTGEIVAAIASAIVTVAGGFFALVRWFVTVWRDVRREELVVARESAAAQRADANRTIEVMLATSSNIASLEARVDGIPAQVAALLWRDHGTTPPLGVPYDEPLRPDPPSERRRMQALEQQPVARFPGDRPPARGRRND